MQSSLRTREFYRNGNPTVIQSVPISLSPQDHVIVYCCVYEKKIVFKNDTNTYRESKTRVWGGCYSLEEFIRDRIEIQVTVTESEQRLIMTATPTTGGSYFHPSAAHAAATRGEGRGGEGRDSVVANEGRECFFRHFTVDSDNYNV